MGGVLSPMLASVVMNDLIDASIQQIHTKPKFLYFYVDDTICLTDKQNSRVLLGVLNRYHKDIEFTMEAETDCGINFLNVTLIRSNEKILTNWYKKPFASKRYVNFFSNGGKEVATGTADAMIKTVLRLSDPIFFQENKAKVENILRDNCFPESSIIGIINSTYTLMRSSDTAQRNPFPQYKEIKLTTTKEHPKKKINKFVALPLLNTHSLQIKQEISHYSKNITISNRPVRNNSFTGTPLKDKIPANEVYKGIVKGVCQCKEKVCFETIENNLEECKKTLENRNADCHNDTHHIHKTTLLKHQTKPHLLGSLTQLISYSYKDQLLKPKELPNRIWRDVIDKKMR